MDTDGDGVLSMFELEYFYEEQCERMERMGIEPLPFQDLLCQMLDLVKPENQGERQRQLGLRVSTGDTKPAFLWHMHVFVCMLLTPGKITLGDLKRCRMAHIFFDTFFNLEKYLDHEQRDPFAVQKVWICISDIQNEIYRLNDCEGFKRTHTLAYIIWKMGVDTSPKYQFHVVLSF